MLRKSCAESSRPFASPLGWLQDPEVPAGLSRAFRQHRGRARLLRRFLRRYNGEHHRSGIGLNTPNDVHYGRAQQVREARARVLIAAHAAHPERFVHGAPEAPELTTAVWINKPSVDQP